MRKFLSLIMALFILGSFQPVKAEENILSELSRASSALLIDSDSGTTILEKDSEKETEAAGLKRLPALLTVCRAFDNGAISEDDIVNVSDEAAKIKGPTAFISENERIDAGQLLKAAVMLTAGDAICALLRHIYSSESMASDAVNRTLNEIGLKKLSGDSMGNGTLFSARDIASISSALSLSGSFLKYSSVYLDTLYHEKAKPTELNNPNRLVRFYTGCFGTATGSVGSTEYAGSFTARRGSTCYICVILGAPDSGTRFKLAQEMLDYGFSMFRTVKIEDKLNEIGTIKVNGGKEKEAYLIPDFSGSILMPIGETRITTEALLPDVIEAPIEEGTPVGTLRVINSKGEIIAEVQIKIKNTVERAVFGDYFRKLIRSFLKLKS